MLNVFNVDFIEEMEKSYLDYSLSVIKDRAIPDIMGCKPIHNRVLYGASLLGLASSGAYKKSARLVGEIIGRLSPHGDTSAYEAMARMSQDWNVRYPLIDMGGNNGSCDGDSPAAMRYTLCRLSKIGEEMLKDLKKDSVDWKPNFSEDEMEPCSMSGFFPNILANGTSGIAVGYSSNFAPHNLKETVSAINATIENSDITIEELVEKYIQGPDFPLGGEIVNKKDIVKIYKEGKGGFITRGRYKVEDKGRTIVFYDMPFSAKKSNLIGEIVQCVRDNKIDGISNITDETTTKEFRIAITLKRGFDADVIANKIYAYTRMQQTVSINQNVLLNGEPKQLNLKEIIDQYIVKCLDIIKRKTNFSLNKISDRLHLIEGLLIALEDIDNVIALIKSSSNAKDAILNLKNKYNLSEVQASAIVDMKLKKLTGLEKIELETENKELIAEKDRLNAILQSEQLRKDILTTELNRISATYGDARRTNVINVEPKTKDTESIQFVQPEEVVVVMTKDGYIKKVPAKSFKTQARNGKGIKNQSDLVLDVIKTNTIDTLMMFTSGGKIFKLLVDHVPTGTNATKGIAVNTLIKTDRGDSIIAITSEKRKTDVKYVVIITNKGLVKKSLIEEYSSIKKNGAAALRLKEGDEISSIVFLNEEQLLLATKEGMIIRFNTSDIRPVGRVAMGVKGMTMNEKDIVVSAIPITKPTDLLAVFSSTGLSRKSELKEIPLQGRGGKGVTIYKTDTGNGTLVSVALVEDKDNLLIVGDKTSICLSAKDIPLLGRTTVGNAMIKDNTVLSVIKI